MYSLYRAWFGGNGTTGEENLVRSRESLSPPDTVIRVGNEGEHQFVAHKGVLAAHSGYLKALLSGTASLSNSCPSDSDSSIGQQPPAVTSLSVSSVGGEAFAPLLNYMYTGRLEVTLDNVYSVLLATHLLHMPGALEQCRAALLRLRAHQGASLAAPIGITVPESSSASTSAVSSSCSSSSRILRPIPNRPIIGPPASICWPPQPPTASLYPSSAGMSGHLPPLQPPTTMLMRSSVHSTTAISLLPTSMLQETQESSVVADLIRREGSRREIEESSARASSSRPISSVSLPFVTAFTAFAASNNTLNPPAETTATSPASLSSSPSLSTPPSSPNSPNYRGASGSATATATSSRSLLLPRRSSKHRRDKGERELGRQRTSEKEIEQHHHHHHYTRDESSPQNRRDNTGESSGIGGESDRARLAKRRGRSNSCNEDSSGSAVVYDVACCDGPVRFHRVLNESYSSSSCNPTGNSVRSCHEGLENDENGAQNRSEASVNVTAAATAVATALNDQNSLTSYTCGYCRHTFKSQYCYKKHTKRHLLPTGANNNPDEESNRRQQRRDNSSRSPREVRLLDLNVQYYPCKICGCKFPSYYFVHKHRKLCHSNVEDNSREGNVEDGDPAADRDQPSSRTSYENTNDTMVNVDGQATTSMDFDAN